MTEEEEAAYLAGERRMLINMFSHFAREFSTAEVMLGEAPEKEPVAIRRQLAALQAERLEAVAALRALCADYGDNDWTDDLNLSDVIEKHLARHLGEEAT